MKSICAIVFSLMCLFTNAQIVHIDQLDKDFTSYLPKSEQRYIDSVLNANEFTISLVSLKPECDSNGDCYPVSVINEDFENFVFDSTFFESVPLHSIQTQLFDSIVPLNINYYKKVLDELLMGEPPSEGSELIQICYNPRHAVIIQDAKEEVLGIYELCFECDKSKVAFSKIITINGSSDLYGLFLKHGLISPK